LSEPVFDLVCALENLHATALCEDNVDGHRTTEHPRVWLYLLDRLIKPLESVLLLYNSEIW